MLNFREPSCSLRFKLYNQDSRAKIHHNCSALNLERPLLAAQLFKVGKCLPAECEEEDVRQTACCCCYIL